MIFITINSKDGDVKELNSFIEQGKQIFILFYMEGCGPCNATRPEWKKIENILKKKYNQNQNILIAEVDQALISKIPLLKKQPSGFPTMFYITNNGNLLEDYEESDILLKDIYLQLIVNQNNILQKCKIIYHNTKIMHKIMIFK